MKIKSLNTQKREILIISASIAMLLILAVFVFLLSSALASKIEKVYSNEINQGIKNNEANITQYNKIIKSIFPDKAEGSKAKTPATSASPSSTLTQ